jgi:C4-type Zn-finger protein
MLDVKLADISGIIKKKKKEFLKAKIEELETNSKIKNIRDLCRDINDFKKDYQPRTNIVNDEKSNVVVDSHNNLARCRNYFSQLLNIYGG